MSVEVLRRAAAHMRENARAATSGPWSIAYVENQAFAVHRGAHDTVALYASRPDARHIASWHPDVALAVAQWLEATAEDIDRRGVTARLKPAEVAAVEFARTYLGETPCTSCAPASRGSP